jgi:hypothetical protein
MSAPDGIDTYGSTIVETQLVDSVAKLERRGPLVIVSLGQTEIEGGNKLRRINVRVAMLQGDAVAIAERILAAAHEQRVEHDQERAFPSGMH